MRPRASRIFARRAGSPVDRLVRACARDTAPTRAPERAARGSPSIGSVSASALSVHSFGSWCSSATRAANRTKRSRVGQVGPGRHRPPWGLALPWNFSKLGSSHASRGRRPNRGVATRARSRRCRSPDTARLRPPAADGEVHRAVVRVDDEVGQRQRRAGDELLDSALYALPLGRQVDGVELAVAPVADVERVLVLRGELRPVAEADAGRRAGADVDDRRAGCRGSTPGYLPAPFRQPNSLPLVTRQTRVGRYHGVLMSHSMSAS